MVKIFRITIMALLLLSIVSLANAANMNYIGDWIATSIYPVGNVVLYKKAIYYSLKSSQSAPNKSKIPDKQPLWWKPLGTVGNTVHNGTTTPIPSIGNVGDFYIDTAQNKMYGPKTATGWPGASISLVGPQGIQGEQGPEGPKGATGATGATGPRGATGLQGLQGIKGVKGDIGPAGTSYYDAQEGDPCTHPTSEYVNTDVLVKIIDESEPIPGQTEYYKCQKIEIRRKNPDNNHLYYLYTEGKFWDEAKKACEDTYGNLATLTNEQEHNWFNQQFNSVSELSLGGFLNNNGEWEWVTGEAWNFNGWGEGQPDNPDGNEEVLMMYMGPDSGAWGDYSKAWSLPYVCEWGENDSAERLLNPTNGHYYQIKNQYMTWSGAKNECEQTGGYLVTVTSQEEDQWVFSNVSPGEEIWMGATDQVAEGIWQWLTGEEFNYTNWSNEQPDDCCGGQDYLQSFSDGLWDDDGGPGDRYDAIKKFVCEWNG